MKKGKKKIGSGREPKHVDIFTSSPLILFLTGQWRIEALDQISAAAALILLRHKPCFHWHAPPQYIRHRAMKRRSQLGRCCFLLAAASGDDGGGIGTGERRRRQLAGHSVKVLEALLAQSL